MSLYMSMYAICLYNYIAMPARARAPCSVCFDLRWRPCFAVPALQGAYIENNLCIFRYSQASGTGQALVIFLLYIFFLLDLPLSVRTWKVISLLLKRARKTRTAR